MRNLSTSLSFPTQAGQVPPQPISISAVRSTVTLSIPPIQAADSGADGPVQVIHGKTVVKGKHCFLYLCAAFQQPVTLHHSLSWWNNIFCHNLQFTFLLALPTNVTEK